MATRTLPFSSKILPGLLVAAAGVLLTLHNLDVVHVQGLWRYWPLILIGFGLSQVFDSDRRSRGAGAVLLGLGVLLQLINLGLLDIRIRDLWRFWPLLFIALGIGLLARKPSNVAGGLIFLGLGTYFQLSLLNVIHLSLWQLWPVVLIVIGIGMVQKALQARRWSG